MRQLASLLTLLFLLAACAPPAAPPLPVEATPHPWAVAPELVGSEWILVELNGAAPVEGSEITLEFEADQLGGYAGCNWYGTTYRNAEDADAAMGFSLTKRACAEPAGVMEQEQAFMAALQAAAGRRLAGDRLEYHDASGATLAAFKARPQLDLDPADLVGTRWEVVSLNGAAPLDGPRPTLVFESATELTGYAGCRDFRATYQAAGDDLSLAFMEMLTTDCPDEARLLQEGEYTTLLSEATGYRLAEGVLEILAVGGRTLVFEPAK